MCLQATGILHFGDLPLIRRKANRIQREGRRLVLNFECVLVDPYGNLFASQPIFPKKAPMFELYVSMPIHMARKLCGIQRPREHLFRVGAPQHSTKHCVRAVPPILALAMGVMVLTIVVVSPGLMGLLDLRPACVPLDQESSTRVGSAWPGGRVEDQRPHYV